MPKSLSVEDFPGAVASKSGLIMQDGRTYWTFAGNVSILEGSAVLGFEITDRDSNWFARVESPDGTKSVNIPGCQVQAVHQGGFDEHGAGVYAV